MALSWGPWVGVAQLAVGRREGILRFKSTPRAFLTSLAPWILFPLLAAALGKVNEPVVFILAILVGQLTPPVLTHALAVRWGRGEAWLRYATAYNWCQWALAVAAVVMLFVAEFAVMAGLPEEAGASLLVVGLGLYGLWLHWTVARHGLSLGWLRAAVLVAAVNIVTTALTWRLVSILVRSVPPVG